MTVTYLRLVSSSKTATAPRSAAARIDAAVETMMRAARDLRRSSIVLQRSSQCLKATASDIAEKLPLFDAAEQRLMIERDRAYEIANDAAILERRILQSEPGNLASLTSGLPRGLQAAANQALTA
jgi:hypothetical protein